MMILEIKKLPKYERKKSQPDIRYGVDFQGKKIHPIAGMIYWYTWGEYTFDIRELRKSYSKKECLPIDTNFKMHPCTRFEKISNEIIQLIGETPFIDAFSASGRNVG